MSKAKEARKTSAKKGSAKRGADDKRTTRRSATRPEREALTPETEDGRGLNSDEQKRRVNRSEDSVGKAHTMAYSPEEEDEEKTYQQTQKMRLEDEEDEENRDLTKRRDE